MLYSLMTTILLVAVGLNKFFFFVHFSLLLQLYVAGVGLLELAGLTLVIFRFGFEETFLLLSFIFALAIENFLDHTVTLIF